MLQMRCVYVTIVFGYLRHMYLSGLSIVMRLLLPAEILHFEKKFWSKKRQHKANFLYFLFGVTLRISNYEAKMTFWSKLITSRRAFSLPLLFVKSKTVCWMLLDSGGTQSNLQCGQKHNPSDLDGF